MVNMFQKTLVASLVAFLCVATQINYVAAEEIRIPVGEQAKTQATVDMPTKGMSKERVKNLFGEALEEVPAKGQPPISRWRYQEFTVYFDSNTVIHCVRNFEPKSSPTTTDQ